MLGPKPKGDWDATSRAPNVTRAYDFLSAGNWYQVKKEFADSDGDSHPAGERWLFIGTAYMHYDDVRCFCVSLDGEGEWWFHLMGGPDAQGPILDDLDQYLVAVSMAFSDSAHGSKDCLKAGLPTSRAPGSESCL